ncbi:tetratricopeptide repeat protein [Winogradskyella maritima]|uniref:Sensor histidine kinase n=1 Tax=Winogradskyella maritima TaxID=1517766 RepID=A0ABV8AEU2_9FLAO|nr:tetratricopeptide repeat protein [Winogradskyella maritima]
MLNRFGVLLLTFITGCVYSQDSGQLSRIIELRNLSSDEAYDQSERIKYAKEASLLSEQINIDSTLLISNRNLALLYKNFELIDDWVSVNKSNLLLAKKINDSLALGAIHYNLGLNNHFYQYEYDSAYYHYLNSIKFYDALSAKKNLIASMHLFMASMQHDEKDYIGAEENAITALRLFESFEKTESNLDNIWSLFNLLGIISLDLERYDEALEYHEQAINIANRMDDGGYNETISINNQASVYRELFIYDKAIELYNELIELREEYEPYDPTFYPLIIDNLAYTKVLAGETDDNNIQSLFYEAYRISDSLNDPTTKLAISIDLSKYYQNRKIQDSSLKFALQSNKIAKEISDNDLLLESMLVLSDLYEGEKGKTYLREHIALKDSLQTIERNKVNKFARIELETDKLEAENEQINKERRYLFLLSIGLLLTGILVYVIITQRAKNKELRLMQDQQKANEEIYNLMLGQQDKVDEARAQEKIRVSKELHDGILGRLFGTRLSLDSLNFVDGKDAIKSRTGYIDQLKGIEEDIRKISHELNTDFVSGSGFMDIVSELIDTQSQAYGLQSSFNYTDDISWEIMSNKSKINIYRIIQESMQNIYKHADAQRIDISISLKKDVICLEIVDDGKGFDTSRGKRGIGLKNMTSRATEINGNLDVISSPGNGATVDVKIPYNL